MDIKFKVNLVKEKERRNFLINRILTKDQILLRMGKEDVGLTCFPKYNLESAKNVKNKQLVKFTPVR